MPLIVPTVDSDTSDWPTKLLGKRLTESTSDSIVSLPTPPKNMRFFCYFFFSSLLFFSSPFSYLKKKIKKEK
jgi:hypothetical protein